MENLIGERRIMKNFIAWMVVSHYALTAYYEMKSCVSGNLFGFSLEVGVTLMVANTFLIIYLQLKGE
jgi:hypothetical protein